MVPKEIILDVRVADAAADKGIPFKFENVNGLLGAEDVAGNVRLLDGCILPQKSNARGPLSGFKVVCQSHVPSTVPRNTRLTQLLCAMIRKAQAKYGFAIVTPEFSAMSIAGGGPKSLDSNSELLASVLVK